MRPRSPRQCQSHARVRTPPRPSHIARLVTLSSLALTLSFPALTAAQSVFVRVTSHDTAVLVSFLVALSMVLSSSSSVLSRDSTRVEETISANGVAGTPAGTAAKLSAYFNRSRERSSDTHRTHPTLPTIVLLLTRTHRTQLISRAQYKEGIRNGAPQ